MSVFPTLTNETVTYKYPNLESEKSINFWNGHLLTYLFWFQLHWMRCSSGSRNISSRRHMIFFIISNFRVEGISQFLKYLLKENWKSVGGTCPVLPYTCPCICPRLPLHLPLIRCHSTKIIAINPLLFYPKTIADKDQTKFKKKTKR